jgi:hypothetical protein
LAHVLAIVDGGTGDRCRCIGWPTIMVYDVRGELMACWTLHHQSGLRGIGDCVADLQDGPAPTEWLAERGLTGSRNQWGDLADCGNSRYHPGMAKTQLGARVDDEVAEIARRRAADRGLSMGDYLS